MAAAPAAARPGAIKPQTIEAAEQQQQPADGDDWARVQAAGKIVIGTAADYRPFSFYDTNYAFDGFDIAVFKAMGERLGVTVEFNDFAFSGLLDALQLGQVDAAISAISVTPERQAVIEMALVRTGITTTIRSASDLPSGDGRTAS